MRHPGYGLPRHIAARFTGRAFNFTAQLRVW
jgi:hypothetical protein